MTYGLVMGLVGGPREMILDGLRFTAALPSGQQLQELYDRLYSQGDVYQRHLDEIQRLVPGYDLSRINLLAGNSQHTSLAKSGTGVAHRPESIDPANENLFSSGTLGRYSRALQSVIESHEVKPAEVAAD